MFSSSSFRHIWLIALRDFRQTLSTKSFWLTVVLLPLVPLLIGKITPGLINDREHESIIILDQNNQIAPQLSADLKKYDPTNVTIPAPPNIAHAQPDQLNTVVAQFLAQKKGPSAQTFQGYIIAIPNSFPQTAQVHVWSSHSPGTTLAVIKKTLSHYMRTHGMVAAGLTDDVANHINDLAPDVDLHTPPHGFSPAALIRIGPTCLSYLLLISAVFSIQWLLQALVEERSGKLLETLLACVTPTEIMLGKLLATLMSLCLLVGSWTGAAIAFLLHFAPQFGLPSETILNSLLTPRVLIGAPFFMLTGSSLVAMLTLAISVRCETMREAQGMLAPLLVLLILPVQTLLQMSIAGAATQTISEAQWVPLWTPFLDLAQINSAPLWQLLVQGAEMLLTCAILIPLLKRLFEHSILDHSSASGWKEMSKTILKIIKKQNA
ncbi:sodium export permease [Neokomagataea thailandica NBRC 106555]|nr:MULTISPECIES: ABC transporter permease subunit [Neokomagataea]GBR53001.1 sodium export permease [Neokomagataea thailandica NBRC 106555]